MNNQTPFGKTDTVGSSYGKVRIKMEEKKYENECNCQNKRQVSGIVCDAKNCTYNDGKCGCHASEVCVGPCDADCSSDTVCVTFRPKTY